jgi:hypothetical protein
MCGVCAWWSSFDTTVLRYYAAAFFDDAAFQLAAWCVLSCDYIVVIVFGLAVVWVLSGLCRSVYEMASCALAAVRLALLALCQSALVIATVCWCMLHMVQAASL